MSTAAYIDRSLEPVIKRAAREFPAVVLTGPRQSGKTTLLKQIFGKKYEYVSLEPPDVRAAATQDPRSFLDLYRPPVILDEVQYTPNLLPYIKERIDSARDTPGQYLLTGSENLAVTERVSESLAGRVAMLRLLPLSYREMEGRPARKLAWETSRRQTGGSGPAYRKLWKGFLRGGYPELVAHPKRDIGLWHAGYVQTYLERDVRNLRQVGDLSQFQLFVRALAARSGQLLNLSGLSRDLGVAVNTIKAWLSVLEATYQVIVLRPYHANVGKRLVKAPKVYFSDVGTLCHLTGLKDADHAAAGPLGGAIMETAVISEVVKTLTHRGVDPRVYFWRTGTGTEVDLVVETGNGIVPIEVKLSTTPRPEMAVSIWKFRADLGKNVPPGFVIHPGDVTIPLGNGTIALPFSRL